MNKLLLVFLLISVSWINTVRASQKKVEITGTLETWHRVTLTFDGPAVSESDDYNPFFNYRLNVTFTHPETGKSYVVPGFFAADGDAANTSATEGNKWRVYFAPDETGTWNYRVQFRKGNWVAVSEADKPGESGSYMDGMTGSFTVAPTQATGRDFRARGRLEYVGKHYLKFAGTGEYFLKSGADAPENFLAYSDFDGNFKHDGHKDSLVKTWAPHIRDWHQGDPTWQHGKGKGIIGALNYLASKGMNSVSFLTMNIEGDDRNVFPYTDYNTWDRFDVSKLAQWEIVFEHADQLGIFLHFKTQETENQGLLDHGGIGALRKLYYRELIARFGHHLALNWNLGEENGEWETNHHTPPQTTRQRRAMAQYFYDHDPYHHPIVVHNGRSFNDLLGNKSKLTGPSVQTSRPDFSQVHGAVLEWREKSEEAGRPWAVSVDEPGDAGNALLPDADNPEHTNARENALWGAYMAGAWGIEWYFGYEHSQSDLTCQDWRSRDKFWEQCRYALNFFKENDIPYWQMRPDDALTQKSDDYCFYKEGNVYIFYQKTAAEIPLDLSDYKGNFRVKWYNPRTGEYVDNYEMQGGNKLTIQVPDKIDPSRDWAILVQKVN